MTPDELARMLADARTNLRPDEPHHHLMHPKTRKCILCDQFVSFL